MRLIHALVFLLIAANSLAQSKGEKLFEDGKAAINGGDTDKAVRLIQNARTEFLKARNYDRYFVTTQSLVIIYQDSERAHESVAVIQEAFHNIPRDTPANLELHAKLYDNLGYGYLYLLGDLHQALGSYNASIRLYTQAGKANTPDIAFELVNRAVVFHDLTRFDSAIVDLKNAIDIYTKDGGRNPRTLADAYQQLAANYREADQHNNGIDAYRKAMSLVTDKDDWDFWAALQNDLGITMLAKGDVMEAMPYLEKAKAINEVLYGKDADHYCQNLINTGNGLKAMGDYDGALAQYEEALAIYTTSRPANIIDQVDLYVNLAQLKWAMGLSVPADQYLEEAKKLASREFGENSIVVADVLVSAAAMAFNQARFDESLNMNFAARHILETQQFAGTEFYAMIDNNVGQAYDELFETDLALKYKSQAKNNYEKIFGASSKAVAMATGNIGLTHEMAGNYDEALKYLNKALDTRISIQGRGHDDVGTLQLNIGLVYLKKLRPRDALTHLQAAYDIYGNRDKHRMKAMILNRIAAAEDLLHRPVDALRHFQEALVANIFNYKSTDPKSFPRDPDFIDYYEMLISCFGKAELFLEGSDPNALTIAAEHVEAADAILKKKAIKLNNPKDRLELAQVNAFFTEAGLKLAAKGLAKTKDPAWLEKAFYYSERNKANELYADIRSTRALETARVPARKLRQLDDLTATANTLEQQIAAAYQAANQPLITRLKARQFAVSGDIDALQKNIGFAAFETNRDLPGWKDVQKVIDTQTAIIMYTITDSSKYVLVGTSTGLTLHELPRAGDIEKMVRGFRAYITTKSPDVATISAQLYDRIWAPVETVLSANPAIRKLIIIPDGPLASVPFEAIGKTEYLVNKYNIRYHVSAAMLLAGGQPAPKKPSLIAMAPVFDDKATNFVNKSCERMVNGTKRTDANDRSFSLSGEYIMPLPATEDEVQQIHKLHQQKDLFTRYFLKEGAHEELIKKGELASYDYIHLATHGIVNTQYPELSGLLLTQDAGSKEDGVLYSGEILGLQLKADLVTLSACETALGRRVEGEGVRGLTSAFLYAGAQTVVVSLWKVADESTAVFMVEFYNQLLSGNDKSTSLRLARQKLMNDDQFRHPYYWAPFVQIGDN